MASDKQIDANRKNAQLSHGAVTPAGKAICSKNAITHGLCGETILIPSDDLAAYHKLVALITKKYSPETDAEKLVVESIANTEWRLLRIPVLEAGLFAEGRLHHQTLHPDIENPEQAHVISEAAIQHNYSRTLSNLTLQEGRLQRKLEKKIAEFNALRAEREAVQTARRDMAMKSIMGANSIPHPCVGFEFSFQYLAARIEFLHYSPNADVALFDRTWKDKSAKTPA